MQKHKGRRRTKPETNQKRTRAEIERMDSANFCTEIEQGWRTMMT